MKTGLWHGLETRQCKTIRLERPHPLRAALEKARENGARPSARRGFDGRRGLDPSGRGAQLHACTAARPRITVGALGAALALCLALLAPAAASAHFTRPFLKGITGTPTGEEGAIVPFAGPDAITVDGEGNLWVGETSYPKPVELDEYGPTGSYLETLHPRTDPESIAVNDSMLGPYAGDIYLAGTHGEGCCTAFDIEIINKAGEVQKVLTPVSYESQDIAFDNSTDPLDPSSGDFYLKAGHNYYQTLHKFNAAGEPKEWVNFSDKGFPKCECSLSENHDEIIFSGGNERDKVYVNQANGDLWVQSGHNFFEFSPGGEVIGQILGSDEEVPGAPGTEPGTTGFYGVGVSPEGIAIDPTNGDILVAVSTYGGGFVDEFDSEGRFLGQLVNAGSQPIGGAFGIATNSLGDVYLLINHLYDEGKDHGVDEFGPGHFVPTLRPGPPTARKPTSAVLNGFVDPESEKNHEKSGITDCHFEYVSEPAFQANDVNELQSVTIAGASGGTYSLSFDGQSTAATGTGDLVGPASAMGEVIEGSNTITALKVTSGEFVAGEEISGDDIPANTTILSVHPSNLVLSAEATGSAPGATLSAASNVITSANAATGAFGVGEQIAGAGVPAETTIARVGPGKITLSQDITASGTDVALSSALPYNASAAQVQTALESVATMGLGNVAISGENGSFTVELQGALGDAAEPQLGASGSALTPGGASLTTAITRQGGDGWGTAKSVACEEPSAGQIPENDAETPVHAAVTGLESGVAYHYRVAATVGGALGGAAQGAGSGFTAPHAPRISGTAVSDITSTFARFTAGVNPLGSPATYQFQYLTQERYEANGDTFAGASLAPATPAEVGPSGEAGDLPEVVTQTIDGLQPATAYRFRLIATNEAGTTEGEVEAGKETEQVFMTKSGTLPVLPDGRAYELVTPADKEGTEDLFREVARSEFDQPADLMTENKVLVSESGDQLVLTTRAAFGPFPASAQNLYVFTRHPSKEHPERDEWSYSPVASPKLGLQSTSFGAIDPADFSNIAIFDFSGEISSELGDFPMSLVGAPGGPYTTIHVDQPIKEIPLESPAYSETREETEIVGSSRNLGVIALESNNPALAEGVPCAENRCAPRKHPAVHNLFAWSNGEISEVAVQNNGALISTCGAVLGDGDFAEGQEVYDGSISADGSRIFFTAPHPGGNGIGGKGCGTPSQLYMRSGEETVEISKPEAGAPEGSKPHYEAHFVRASEDGSRVFFTSEGELTANDAGFHDPELYEYNTETRKLSRVAAGESGHEEGKVVLTGVRWIGIGSSAEWDIGASADGSHVYFTSEAKLVDHPNAEGKEPKAGERNFYIYDTQSGRTSFIEPGNGGAAYAEPELTANGHYMLFGGERGLERYEVESEHLTCITCVAGVPVGLLKTSEACFACSDTSPPAVLIPSSIMEEDGQGRYVLPPHAISENGAYVFFDTNAPLVPQDTNGVENVYEWHEGKLSLISTGQDPLSSYLLGASADGSNVFFGTHSRLVPADSAGGGNVYDARICTASDPCIQQAPAQEGLCEGDACSHPAPASNDPTPNSLTFSGPGNPIFTTTEAPEAHSGCPKGRKLSHGKCVKAKKAKKARRAKAGARGAKAGSKRGSLSGRKGGK
jgi:hypothetical protein